MARCKTQQFTKIITPHWENEMSVKPDHLIWIDLEMTGLDVDHDRILEIATIITDSDLNILAEGPVLAIHQSEEVLATMNDWNVQHHTKSGLVARVRQSDFSEVKAQPT